MTDLNWPSVFATAIIGAFFATIFGFIGLFINNWLSSKRTLVNQTEAQLDTANRDLILSAISGAKTELSNEIDKVKTDLTNEIDKVKTDLTNEIDKVKTITVGNQQLLNQVINNQNDLISELREKKVITKTKAFSRK